MFNCVAIVLQQCYPKYGSMPIKSNFCHEFAVRMVLGCIDRHANTHGRFIEPLLSVQMDFYVSGCWNVFVQASADAQERCSLRGTGLHWGCACNIDSSYNSKKCNNPASCFAVASVCACSLWAWAVSLTE